MLSLITPITRRALHTLSSVFRCSTIRNNATTTTNSEITRNRKHGRDTHLYAGMASSQEKLESWIKSVDQSGEILSGLKNMSIEAQNEFRSKIGMIHPSILIDDDIRMFYYVFDKFHQMIRDEVGPYLSLEVKDFNSTPSQELRRYWSDKSLDELTQKLMKDHESNHLLREVLERKDMVLDELLSASAGLLEGEKTGFTNIF